MIRESDPIDIEIGRRIRQGRMLIGMTQATLAKTLCLSFQQIQKYEKRTNRVAPGRILAIAHALGVSPSFFFNETSGLETLHKSVPTADDLRQYLSDEDTLALNYAFVAIKDYNIRARIIGLLKAIGASLNSD